MAVDVGLVHGVPNRGGFSAVVREARLLTEAGLSVSVASFSGPRLAELPAQARIVELGVGSRNVARLAAAVRRWSREEQPRVVHVHGRAAGVWARLGLSRDRPPRGVFYTPHGLPWRPGQAARLLEAALQTRLARFTDGFVFVSRAEAADWAREYGLEAWPKLLLPNRASPVITGKGPPPISRSRPLLVLAPGGYHPQKGLEKLVTAACAWDEARGEVVIVGPSPDRRYRARLVDQYESSRTRTLVRFEDEVANLPEALRMSDLVVLPSHIEGLSFVSLEATAVSAAVAWSAIGAHFEVFGESGGAFWSVADLERILRSPRTWPCLRIPHSRMHRWDAWAEGEERAFVEWCRARVAS